MEEKKLFVERTSRLDPMDKESSMQKSELKGFYNLIIIALTVFFIQHEVHMMRTEGTLVGLDRAYWSMFHRRDLFPAWICLIGASFIAVVYQKLKLRGIVPATSILDWVITLAIFAAGTTVALERNWPPIQTAFFTAELLVICMKLHSYIATNAKYTELYFKSKKDDDQKDKENSQPSLFPKNVTFFNFMYFLFVPTLVYELEYPRTQRFRVIYFLEKFSSFVGIWSVLHVVAITYIVPVMENSPKMTVYDAILQLILPFLLASLLIFFMVFDVICNAFAELTKFGDREFYSDWWNSTTFDEWARKWNKPVHDWLKRHVYEESLKKRNKVYASIFTFFLSSLFHEYVMMIIFRIFRPWLFFFQMLQIPLIYFIGRTKMIKGTRLGNLFFWFSMALGPPMISILYCREYYLQFI